MNEPGFCEDGSLCVCEQPRHHKDALMEADKGNSLEKREEEIPVVTQYEKTDFSVEEQFDCSRSCSESRESKTGDVQVKYKSVTGSSECNSEQKCEEEIPLVSQDVQKTLSLAEQVSIVRSCSKGRESKKRNRQAQVKNECDTKKQELDNETRDSVKSNCSIENCAFDSTNNKDNKGRGSKKRNRQAQVKNECDTKKQELDNETKYSVKSNCSIQNWAFDSTNNQETNLKNKDTATMSSTPKVSNHRKRRMTKEKKTNVKKQRCKSHENLLEEEPVWKETGLDALNISLPIPKNTSPSMDSEEMTDSDEDLPEGLTPQGYTNSLHERDLVWVKWKKGLFLPAIVKFVYKKKRRVTLVLFQPEDEPVSQFTMNMGKTVFSYFDPRKTDIMADSRHLPKEDYAFFNACVQRVDEFLQKTALKQLEDDWSFFKEEGIAEEVDETRKESEEEEKEQHPESDSRGFITDIEAEIEPVKKDRGLSKKGLLRKEKLKEKTRDLTKFLLSSECKEHLLKIFKGKTKSEAHKIFLSGTARERLYLKHRGFGPIDDDDQVESIVLTFHSWLKEINQNQHLNANSYVFDVWVPEAVVFGLKKLHRYSTKKAWEMFSKGVRCTKEELQLVHEGLIRKSPEVNNTEEEKFKLFKPPKRLILK